MQSDEPLPTPSRPARPVRPELPEEAKPKGSIWSIVIAGVVGLMLFGGLGVIFLPVIGVAISVVAIGGVFFLIAILHYLVWGYWLRDAIRHEVEEEERIAAENEKKKF
jgi:hypothetical protein